MGFAIWFRTWLLNIFAIAALTLTSGTAGNSYIAA